MVKADMKIREFGTSSNPSPNLSKKAVKPTSSEKFRFLHDMDSASSCVRGCLAIAHKKV